MYKHRRLNRIQQAGLAIFMLGCGVAGVLTSSTSVSAAGVTFYVAPGGTDAPGCTSALSPCETIQYAVDQASNNDIVSVAAGTYNEIVTVEKPLTLKGAQAGVDGRTRSAGAETILTTVGGQDKTVNIKSDEVTIDGFTFDGTTGTNSLGIYLVAPNTKNATIVNNIIKHNKVGVDAIYTDVSGIRVRNNLFDTNDMSVGSNGVYLANVSGSDIEVSSNTIRNTYDADGGQAAAINIYGLVATPLSNVRIENNTSTNDQTMLLLMSASDVVVANNTATNETGTGILIDQGVSNLEIRDNSLSSSAYGIRFSNVLNPTGDPISNVSVTGNTVSGMSVAGIQVAAGAISGGVVVVDNSFTNNAIGINNLGTVAVIANDNWWGCDAGPGQAGCDANNGNVVATSWLGESPGGVPVPGVPNTGIGGARNYVGFIIGMVASIVTLSITGVVVMRRARR